MPGSLKMLVQELAAGELGRVGVEVRAQLPGGRERHIARYTDSVAQVGEGLGHFHGGQARARRRRRVRAGDERVDDVPQRRVHDGHRVLVGRCARVGKRSAEALAGGADCPRSEPRDLEAVAHQPLSRLEARVCVAHRGADGFERVESRGRQRQHPRGAVSPVNLPGHAPSVGAALDATADLRWQGRDVRVRVALDASVPLRLRLERHEPAVERLPARVATHAQPLVVGQRGGHALDEGDEEDVDHGERGAEEERSAAALEGVIGAVHD
mmetsp:Transcript_17778/g.45495  ORF Transcript_17778/g.45495 Transcript_17778/m.45495 type:complete len:269 (-) Transcript_17778:741-1547(-)